MDENDAVIAVLRALGEGGSAAATRKVDQVIAADDGFRIV